MSRTPELVCLGCVPIVDNERTNAYVQWAREEGKFGAGCCTDMMLNFCDLDSPTIPYTNPADDGVCWFDPDIPESEDFLGLWVVDLDGLENDGYQRGTTDIGGEGSVFNRPIRPGKVLTFSVMLLGASCCGLDYGRNWLANVLRGQGCAHGVNRISDSCGTTEIRIRTCCPEEGMADDGIRTFPSSSLTAGVSRSDGDRRDKCCCNYRMYTFVVTTGTPDAFGSEVDVCSNELNPEIIFCRDWDGCEDVVVTEPCIDPTGCGDLFIDAFASPSLRDDCYCPPLEQTINCCCIDEFLTGSSERAIIVDLFAGSNPADPIFTQAGARNIEVVFFENPKNLPCPETQEEYVYFRDNVPVCARVTVGFIPSASQLKIDGRTGEAFNICGGIVIPVYDGVEGDLKKLRTGCVPIVVCSIWDAFYSVYPPGSPSVTPSRMDVSVVRVHS